MKALEWVAEYYIKHYVHIRREERQDEHSEAYGKTAARGQELAGGLQCCQH